MACNCIGGNPCPCNRGAWPIGYITFGPQWTAAQQGPITPQIDLAAMLDKARLHVMSPKESYEQKVSWLRGMTGKLSDPMPTREQAVKALAELGIVDPEEVRNDDIGSR